MNKILQFSLVRIVIAVLFVGVGLIVGQTVLNLLRSVYSITNTGLANLLAFVLIMPATYFAYWLYVHYLEKRETTELRGPNALRELGRGLVLGLGLFSLIIAALWLLGYYRVNGFNLVWLFLVGTFAGAFVSGFVQELIFRAVIYRITEEWLGTWWAIGISALLFGLIHLTSAGATIFSALAVALQAGVLLAVAYALTHRLWLAFGIHLGWDFANDGVFGVGVAGQSGQTIQGLLQANLNGPSLFTGGALGVEASLITLVVMLIASFVLLRMARQRGEWGSRRNQSWLTERLGKTS
jgi:membrane protease YdiL (CAAX protease family)